MYLISIINKMFGKFIRRSFYMGTPITIASTYVVSHDDYVMRNLKSTDRWKTAFSNLYITPSYNKIAKWLNENNDPALIKFIPNDYINEYVLDQLNLDLLLKFRDHKDFNRWQTDKIWVASKNKIENYKRQMIYDGYDDFYFTDTYNENLMKVPINRYDCITPAAIEKISIDDVSDKLFVFLDKLYPVCYSSQKKEINDKVEKIIEKHPEFFYKIYTFDELSSSKVVDMVSKSPTLLDKIRTNTAMLNKINPNKISAQEFRNLFYYGADNNSKCSILVLSNGMSTEWKYKLFGIHSKDFYSTNINRFDGLEIPADIFNKHFSHIEFYDLVQGTNSIGNVKIITADITGWSTMDKAYNNSTKEKKMLPIGSVAKFREGFVEVHTNAPILSPTRQQASKAPVPIQTNNFLKPLPKCICGFDE